MATAEQIVHVSEFTNEPFIDFMKAENRSRMEEALKHEFQIMLYFSIHANDVRNAKAELP